MDISGWSEEQMQSWAEQDSDSRVRDIEQTYYEAKSIKPGVFNRGKWQAAALNLAKLTLFDAEVRATHAADAVAKAISEGRVKGASAERMLKEKGPDVLPRAVFGLVWDAVSEDFAQRNWQGSGVDGNDQAIRFIQCVEYLENFVILYLEDPSPEWKGERGGAVDDGFVPTLDAAKKRVVSKAFSTPGGVEFRPIGLIL